MNIIMMDYAIITVALSILITTALYLLQRHHVNALRHKQLQGFLVLTQLRSLLTHVQQHRGISNGWLNGDESLTQRLNSLAKHVTADINYIHQQFPDAIMQAHTHAVPRWEAITTHWPRLTRNTEKLTPANNLDQHNKLILNILYFIDDIAEHYQIYKLTDTQDQALRHDWLNLLFTAESIGQIRAIGTGVAARKNCSSVERIRLNYLCHSLQQSVEDGMSSTSAAAISTLVTTIEIHITTPQPNMAAEQFFSMASQCIELVFTEFDKQSQEFEQLIYRRSQDVQPRQAERVLLPRSNRLR